VKGKKYISRAFCGMCIRGADEVDGFYGGPICGPSLDLSWVDRYDVLPRRRTSIAGPWNDGAMERSVAGINLN